MERVNKIQITENKPLTWKKIGGGSLRLKKRIIKPGEVFKAFPEEIPPGFRSMVIPIGKDAEILKEQEQTQESIPANIPGNKQKYVVIESEKKGWFNVVDVNKKVLNEKGLRKDDAESLVEALNS